jgi:hypothetical protein
MTNLNQKLIFRVLVTMIIIIGASSALFSQSNSKPKLTKFLILIETTDNGFKLKCTEGCAWTDLTFRIKADSSQLIDQYGMKSTCTKPEKDSKLADFLFSIKKTSEGVSFEGLKGTSFTKLSFSCKTNLCHQYIDENGMTNPY